MTDAEVAQIAGNVYFAAQGTVSPVEWVALGIRAGYAAAEFDIRAATDLAGALRESLVERDARITMLETLALEEEERVLDRLIAEHKAGRAEGLAERDLLIAELREDIEAAREFGIKLPVRKTKGPQQ